MKEGVLIDTGPLVAFLNSRDRYHGWVLEQWNNIRPPLATCEAVLSEACFLLKNSPGAVDSIMEMIQRKVISAPFRLEENIQPIKKLLTKYQSVPVSLADACLVRMSEIYPESLILTLDSDFKLYRKQGRQIIPLIIPNKFKNHYG